MNNLLRNLERVHTTELGAARIERNLSLDARDAAEWCRGRIASGDASFERRGKNWYVRVPGCVITVNASSYTIITAHREK